MTKKEEKPKETIAEPIFEGIPLDVMAALPERVEALAPELAAEIVTLVARPHYDGLRGEMRVTPCTARSLFYYLFYYTFDCGVRIRTQLRVPGVWEVCIEDAEYDVTVYNYTGFDLKDIRVDLSKSADDGKASILSPPGSSILLGDIDYRQRGTGTFGLHGDEAGDITLKVRVSGYVDYWRQRVYKPWYERTYPIH